jgi:peptide deformylase
MTVRPLVIVLLVLSLSACAARRELVSPDFAPTERLLAMRGEGNARMEMVKNDVPAGDVFLRARSLRVRPGDPVVAHLIARMRATLEDEGGVGIAAPQVGVSRRVVLVQRLDQQPGKPVRAYVNPEILEYSKETVVDWEGCLSIPAGFGQVKRAESIVIAYDTRSGERTVERVSGFTARIFQHEIDHLDGILFIDRKEPGELLPEKEYREMRRKEGEQRGAR